MKLTIEGPRRAFGYWLRTGRLPTVRDADGVESKFNPWHDPDDGRFTFAGSGRHYGFGDGDTSARAMPGRSATTTNRDRPDLRKSPQRSVGAGASSTRAQPGRPLKRVGRSSSGPVAEFVLGAGEGAYQTAKGAAAGLYSALTTDPRTTARKIGRSAAATIDAAIAAEDTPARVQITHAASAAKNASARDLGRAIGSTAANVGFAVAPGSAAIRVSAIRHARKIGPRPTYRAPDIHSVKENLGRATSDPIRKYSDGASGAKPGLAPALKRTMPDGTSRWVKFDGIEGDYLIDRKWSIVTRARAKAQALRQSTALAEHGLLATWEVPNSVQLRKARKLLGELNIGNIKVRIVKP